VGTQTKSKTDNCDISFWVGLRMHRVTFGSWDVMGIYYSSIVGPMLCPFTKQKHKINSPNPVAMDQWAALDLGSHNEGPRIDCGKNHGRM
jgi:hypothetical protein